MGKVGNNLRLSTTCWILNGNLRCALNLVFVAPYAYIPSSICTLQLIFIFFSFLQTYIPTAFSSYSLVIFQVEVYKQPLDTFDSVGWRREKTQISEMAQNSFENVGILGNKEFNSYDEIGTADPDLMFGGLESEDGLIKNIFTYEDDDNEIHVDYIAYDESESVSEVPISFGVTKPHGGGDEESVKPERSKNFFKNDKRPGKTSTGKLESSKNKNLFRNDKRPDKSFSGKYHGKKKMVPGKVRNPHHLVSLAKKKRKKAIDASSTASPIEEGLTTNPERVEKADSAEVSGPHKKRLSKFSKGLLRQFLQVPPGLLQAGKGAGENSLHRVSIFVADLTKFATSYNKLANVLLQGQLG